MRVRTVADLGALVREARVRQGLSQGVLGERIGASRFWVSGFEHGKETVELTLVLKALAALGLSVTIGSASSAPDASVRDGDASTAGPGDTGSMRDFDLAAYVDGFALSTGGNDPGSETVPPGVRAAGES